MELIYEPAPAISPEFTEQFEKIVPLSPNGNDRMLRYVWGMDRTDYCAGEQVRRYADLEHEPPKYVGKAAWILEGWQSPSVYDEVEWKEVEHLLGPFPRHGAWEFVDYHIDADGGYLPLDERALKRVRNWAHWQDKGKKRSIDEVMEARMLRWALAEQTRREASERVAQEFGEKVVTCFENATETPTAYSLPGNFTKSDSGILIPEGVH